MCYVVICVSYTMVIIVICTNLANELGPHPGENVQALEALQRSCCLNQTRSLHAWAVHDGPTSCTHCLRATAKGLIVT